MINIQTKNKKLIYEGNKAKIGVKFQIYSDGEVKIHGKGSQYGLNVPAKLRDWIKPCVDQLKGKVKLLANYDFQKETKRSSHLKIKTTLIAKQKNYYLLPENIKCLGTDLHKLLSERISVTCSFLLPRKLWSRKLRNAIQIIQSYSSSTESQLTPIVSGGKRTGYFTLFQDEQDQLLLKLKASIGESGDIQLPAELDRIFKNWVSKKELFLCLFKDGYQVIGQTKFISDKGRPERVRKVLHIPYSGKRKQIKFLCYMPNLVLTQEMMDDYKIKTKLVDTGFQIRSLKSNNFPLGFHRNKLFEQKVRTLLKDAFNNQDGTLLLDEVAIACSSQQESLNIDNEYTFDKVVILNSPNRTSSKLLVLCEIKSSVTKSKNKMVNDSIANLKYYQQQLGEDKVLPILVMNCVFNKRDLRVIDNYGLKNGVLILDQNKLSKFFDQPSLLPKSMISFKQKSEHIRIDSAYTVHPLTQELISKENLRNEALTLLTGRNKDSICNRKTLRIYCLFMNIRISDFNRLYNNFELKFSDMNRESLTLVTNKHTNKSKMIFKTIHQYLCDKGSVATIPKIPQNCLFKSYNTLISSIQQISRILPKEAKIVGFKDYQHKGKSYERFIQKRLELLNYKVIPNVLVYAACRLMEIDLFALKEDELKLVSCKNMGGFHDFPQTTVEIKRAVKLLTFNKQTLNADKGLVCIRVNKQFRDIFKNKFNNNVFADNIEVKITD